MHMLEQKTPAAGPTELIGTPSVFECDRLLQRLARELPALAA